MKSVVLRENQGNQSGMTLLEVMIGMAVTVLVAGGVYAAGISALRLAQTNRIMTEAHTLAKEGIESITSAGYEKFRGGLVSADTNLTDTLTHKVEIIRTTSTIWHADNGSVVTNGIDDGYAEISVRSEFTVPGTSRTASTTLSTILRSN